MYRLPIDCGTAIDVVTFANFNEVKKQLKEYEDFYDDVVDRILDYGAIHCGIDTITLEEVFENYEVLVGTILKDKSSSKLKVVGGFYLDDKGKCGLGIGDLKLNSHCTSDIDYNTWEEISPRDLYKKYSLYEKVSECEFCRLETETIALDEFGMCKDCYKARS